MVSAAPPGVRQVPVVLAAPVAADAACFGRDGRTALRVVVVPGRPAPDERRRPC
ncbi:MAG: hypothetical protein ABI083_10920 [Lapillicoccus sp.]